MHVLNRAAEAAMPKAVRTPAEDEGPPPCDVLQCPSSCRSFRQAVQVVGVVLQLPVCVLRGHRQGLRAQGNLVVQVVDGVWREGKFVVRGGLPAHQLTVVLHCCSLRRSGVVLRATVTCTAAHPVAQEMEEGMYTCARADHTSSYPSDGIMQCAAAVTQ